MLALLVADIDLDQESLLAKRALSGGEVLTPKGGDQRVVLTRAGGLVRAFIDGSRRTGAFRLEGASGARLRHAVLLEDESSTERPASSRAPAAKSVHSRAERLGREDLNRS